MNSIHQRNFSIYYSRCNQYFWIKTSTNKSMMLSSPFHSQLGNITKHISDKISYKAMLGTGFGLPNLDLDLVGTEGFLWLPVSKISPFTLLWSVSRVSSSSASRKRQLYKQNNVILMDNLDETWQLDTGGEWWDFLS